MSKKQQRPAAKKQDNMSKMPQRQIATETQMPTKAPSKKQK